MSLADVDPADTERAVRIDLAAVRHNVGVLQERIRRPDGSRPLLTAVVKADAYGHGAVAVARAAAAAGADRSGWPTCARPWPCARRGCPCPCSRGCTPGPRTSPPRWRRR